MATKIQRFRYDEDDWEEFGNEAEDGNRSGILTRLVDWYLCKPGVTLPDRPKEKHPRRFKLSPAEAKKEAAIQQFIAWYDRKPGADLPDRPPKT